MGWGDSWPPASPEADANSQGWTQSLLVQGPEGGGKNSEVEEVLTNSGVACALQ